MLKLGQSTGGWLGRIPSQDADDPRPFLLPGVRIRFAEIGVKAVRAGRQAIASALRIDVTDIEEAGDELSRALIRRGILEWEGIGDVDGAPVAPTQDIVQLGDDGRPVLGEDGRPILLQEGTISLFLRDPTLYEAADLAYVRPWSDREQEKNGFAGSPNGTSTAATPANATASSPAKKAHAGGANRTRKPAKAGARTSKTNPARTKAKPSGT
jgi:hypothetical protein